MHEFDEDEENHNYWPSVSDLFLTLFVIAIAIVGVVFVSFLPKENVGDAETLIHGMGSNRDRLVEPINQLREKIELPILDKSLSQPRFLNAVQETSTEAIRQLDEQFQKNQEAAALFEAKIQQLEENLKDHRKQLEIALGNTDKGAQMQSLLNLNQDLQKQLSQKEEILLLEKQKHLALIDLNADLEHQLHDKPPNIQISEQREDYRFASGSSEMSSAFAQGLQQSEFLKLADEIVSRNSAGRVKVDTLEIIGHTDGSPVATQGNLDELLPRVITGEMQITNALRAGSNNDLGLLRALAVRKQWRDYAETHPQSHILQNIDVRCYSAGQTIPPNLTKPANAQDLLKPDSAARRIEMRLTRLNSTE